MSVERGTDVTADTTVEADCSTGFTRASTPTFLYNTQQADDPSADPARTMAHLKATHRDFESGLVISEDTERGTSLTLRITYLVQNDNRAQNTASSATFTWEARNT
jgi:hypothetical protein